MKILLTAVNAKYIHSNPAVYSLRACAGRELMPYLEIAEYTINHRKEEILADLYRRKPALIAFSCYIWNWDMISALIKELPKVLPETDIWLGGPEVSYQPEELLQDYPMITGIMVGEGEETFRELAAYYISSQKEEASKQKDKVPEQKEEASKQKDEMRGQKSAAFQKIQGIVYWAERESESGEGIGGRICRTPERELTDISEIPFLYYDLQPFENRILYYESSRGCPYRCSYCLSSIDKKVRLRNLDIVKKELQFFLEHNVKQVKFVDRTFNCNHEHAREIWKYLSEHDNGVTNFHFEIAADIISEEELEILAGMRPGLVQLEIGVQTFHSETLREIRRVTDMDKLCAAVERIRRGGNIHIHLDLIAGLPFEGYESFLHSFNSVYALKPQQLQLGFLKVLKGSYLYDKIDDYGIQYMDAPPYEVLSTKWISYEELLRLKQIEAMVEIYYNSIQFTYTMPFLQSAFPDAFTMYLRLAEFYEQKGCLLMTPARIYRYQVLLDFAMNTKLAEQKELLYELLTFDLYLRENSKSRPDFAKDLTPYKADIRGFYQAEEESRRYLPAYAGCDSRQLGKMTHIELFDYPVWEENRIKRMEKLPAPVMVLFDYQNRNALTYEAKYTIVGDLSLYSGKG